MTLAEAIRRLRDAGVDSPAHDAREIFATLGEVSSADLLFPDSEADDNKVAGAIARRAAREPLQYILGEVGFYRELYHVSPDCLIPRAETELLADFAVRHLPRGARFLDLCTGSGCVAVSVLRHTEQTTAVAVDLSRGALAVARKNAARYALGARIEFLLADATREIFPAEERFFAVLANPPYVSRDAYAALAPEIGYEPREAFVGGEDGGDFYRALIPLYKNHLPPDGFLAFEIGYDQSDLLVALAAENGMKATISRDLSDLPRLAVLTFPSA